MRALAARRTSCRPGRTDLPIVYDVENVRDGGSFSSRRVVARQGGTVIFYLSSSFHSRRRASSTRTRCPTDVPTPEDCPTLSEVLSQASGRPASMWEQEWGVLEVRYVGDSRPRRHPGRPGAPGPGPGLDPDDGALADDPRLHQARSRTPAT